MFELWQVGGAVGGECYLLADEGAALLLDSGFDFCAEKTVANIRERLNGRKLNYILASHSHYDHMSGIPTIKRAFPDCLTVGSEHARAMVAKENVRAQMRELNASYARDKGLEAPADRIDELTVDVALADGEELPLPGMTVRGVATPGHTRCAMSYYIPERRFLFCSETLGITPQYPEVTPCFIVGYEMTLDSIERSRRLRPERVLISHSGLVPDGETELFFNKACQAVKEAVGLLVEMHDAGSDDEAIIDAFLRKYYAGSADLQPERAFVLNTQALIPRILRELGKKQ